MTVKKMRQNAVLAAYRETANVLESCKAAEVARSQHYEWLRDDPVYREQFAGAQTDAARSLQDEAVRRAYQGVDEPVVFQGQFTFLPLRDETGAILRDEQGNARIADTPLCVRKYSDSLLQFLLKGLRRDVFGDKVKVEGSVDLVHRFRAAEERLKKHDSRTPG